MDENAELMKMMPREVWQTKHTFLGHQPNSDDLDLLPISKCVCFEFEHQFGSSHPNDGYIWENSRKNITPSYDRILVDGEIINLTRCRNAENQLFMKEVLYFDTKYIVRYMFLGGEFKNLRTNNTMRLTKRETEIILEVGRGKKSCEEVKKELEKQGFFFSFSQVRFVSTKQQKSILFQIQNQLKKLSCVEMTKKKTGRQAVSTPQNLHSLRLDRPTTSEILEPMNENGERTYIFLDHSPEALRVFANCCPPNTTFEEHVSTIRKIEKATDYGRLEVLDDFVDEHGSNRFRACVYGDTTYRLTDAFGTFFIAEIGSKFRTRSKDNKNEKSRIILLFWSFHTTKELVSHETIANYMKKTLARYKNLIVPCYISDGEISFGCYEKILNWKQLRCEQHVKYNIQEKFKGKSGKSFIKLLFGENINGTWSLGLLGAMTQDEFENRIEISKSDGALTEEQYKWIKSPNNLNMLFERCSLKAKLDAGLCLSFNTTNQVEQFNVYLKSRCPKRSTVDIVAKVCAEISKEQIADLYNSLKSANGPVYAVDFVETCVMSNIELQEYMESVGLKRNEVYSWDIPSDLRSMIKFEKMDGYHLLTENMDVESFQDIMIVTDIKDGKKIYVNLERNKDQRSEKCWTCSSCSFSYPYYFCTHLYILLQSLDENERTIELLKIEKFIKLLTERQRVCFMENRSAGEKFRRRGTQISHSNHVRSVVRIVDKTPMVVETQSENSIEEIDETSEDFEVTDDFENIEMVPTSEQTPCDQFETSSSIAVTSSNLSNIDEEIDSSLIMEIISTIPMQKLKKLANYNGLHLNFTESYVEALNSLCMAVKNGITDCFECYTKFVGDECDSCSYVNSPTQKKPFKVLMVDDDFADLRDIVKKVQISRIDQNELNQNESTSSPKTSNSNNSRKSARLSGQKRKRYDDDGIYVETRFGKVYKNSSSSSPQQH